MFNRTDLCMFQYMFEKKCTSFHEICYERSGTGRPPDIMRSIFYSTNNKMANSRKCETVASHAPLAVSLERDIPTIPIK